MVIWVCEASEVNNLTVLAVGPNHRDDVLRRLCAKIAEVMRPRLPLLGRYPLDPTTISLWFPASKNVQNWDFGWKHLVGVVRDIYLLHWTSMMMCIGSHLKCKQFEDTFENTQWRKVTQVSLVSMSWLYHKVCDYFPEIEKKLIRVASTFQNITKFVIFFYH